MVDAIDVMGDADTVHATMRAYADAGVDVPVLMPLPWGAGPAGPAAATIRPRAPAGRRAVVGGRAWRMELRDRICVVTGGGQRHRPGAVPALRRRGAQAVVVVDRDADGAVATAGAIGERAPRP